MGMLTGSETCSHTNMETLFTSLDLDTLAAAHD